MSISIFKRIILVFVDFQTSPLLCSSALNLNLLKRNQKLPCGERAFLNNIHGFSVDIYCDLMCFCVNGCVCFHRFPDNFEKLSPPVLQLDEVDFYYSPDHCLFTGLCVSADLESRICIVRQHTLKSHVLPFFVKL